jgi:hypothetical protein
MRFGTTSASACTDRIAALAASNSCPPPSQFCVVRVEKGWKVRRRLVARATETGWARTWQYVTRYASAGTSGAPEAAATPRA